MSGRVLKSQRHITLLMSGMYASSPHPSPPLQLEERVAEGRERRKRLARLRDQGRAELLCAAIVNSLSQRERVRVRESAGKPVALNEISGHESREQTAVNKGTSGLKTQWHFPLTSVLSLRERREHIRCYKVYEEGEILEKPVVALAENLTN